MSVRDEIVERLYERCQHSKASVGGSVRVLRCSACDAIADALLPIVERVAREVGDLAERKMLEILASGRADWLCGLMPHEINDIVSRVMEGGQ